VNGDSGRHVVGGETLSGEIGMHQPPHLGAGNFLLFVRFEDLDDESLASRVADLLPLPVLVDQDDVDSVGRS
jgi:hypothetical protein